MASPLYALLGYLLGSIPFGLILTRSAGLGDIRRIGSGNIGATNVLRTGNKALAAATLLLDCLKGAAAVGISARLGDNGAVFLAGAGAVLGHAFPVWLGFKGGKGVATAFGVLLGWSWPLALIGALAWLLMFLWKRISSLSALTSAAVAVIASFILGDHSGEDIFGTALWPRVVLVAIVVVITHRANIQRLLAGTEPKSNFSKTT